MSIQAIHETFVASQAGLLVFPEVVRRLLDAGVESYFADLAASRHTIYLQNGSTHTETAAGLAEPIPDAFSADGIVAAIRAAQSDRIRYPEFVMQATAAGVIAYWAFLTGRKVVYFGRQGAFHIEEFPRLQS